jgi:hypothetical protein
MYFWKKVGGLLELKKSLIVSNWFWNVWVNSH